MNAEERSRLVRGLALAGNCSHPIQLRGEMVNMATGEVGESLLRVACKDRREAVCPACSYLYKADAWILVASGLVGGKWTPESVSTHPRLFVTLTAPSFGPVHTITSRGSCVTQPVRVGTASGDDEGDVGHASRFRESSPRLCRHLGGLTCPSRHVEDDRNVGKPLCEECYDFEGTVLWNASASQLWSRTILHLRRFLAESAGVNQGNLKKVAQIHYLKVAEIQRRGSVHFHALLRADGPEGIDDDSPIWLTNTVLAHAFRSAVHRAQVDGLNGLPVAWGRMLDVQDLSIHADDPLKVASYIAKYSTKATDGSRDLARRFNLRRQIEIMVDDPHARRLALTAWDLSESPQYSSLNLHRHAHAFGYTGHLITKSRGYSTTFAALRGARAQYMAAQNTGDPIEGTFHFEGRGYDDPRGVDVAEVFFLMRRELRREAAEARREGHVKSQFASTESLPPSTSSTAGPSEPSVSKECELT